MTTDLDRTHAVALRDGLRAERRIYESLADLSERQEQILAAGAGEEILRLARAKEVELIRIDEVEQDLAPLKATWRELRERLSGELRAEVESELDAIERVLRRLIEAERTGQDRLASNQQQTSERLRQVDSGRRVQRAYHNGAAPPPRYVDRTE